jgi:hypothetical protein
MDMSPNRPTSYPKGSMTAYLRRSPIRMLSLLILISMIQNLPESAKEAEEPVMQDKSNW